MELLYLLFLLLHLCAVAVLLYRFVRRWLPGGDQRQAPAVRRCQESSAASREAALVCDFDNGAALLNLKSSFGGVGY